MPIRSFTTAEITLTERRRLEYPLLAMIWMGVAALSMAENSVFYLLFATTAVAVNLWALGHKREVHLSRPIVNAAVLLATVVPVIEILAADIEMLSALAHYLVLIQLCKLFQRKSNRDYVQMLAMSGPVMISATVRCETVWFAALLLVYLALACYTAMVFTLKRGLDAAAAARLATETGPMAPQRVAWNVTRHWPGRTLRRNAASILTTILLAGLVMFLVAPRNVNSGSGFGRGASGKTGFTNEVRLGRVKKVYLSDRIVMRVRTSRLGSSEQAAETAPTGIGQTPGSQPRFTSGQPATSYLRGAVFYRYADSEWEVSETPYDLPPREWDSSRRLDPPGGAIVHEISMVPEYLPTLLAAQPTVRAASSDGEVSVVPGERLSLSIGSRPAPNHPIRYTAHVWPHPLTAPQRRFLSAARRPIGRTDVKMKIPPRVAALARRWCADLGAERTAETHPGDQYDLRIAERLAQRLRQHCTYTLNLAGTEPGRDGVEQFLFETREGHCEYFASAMTVMCRSLGVRARLATGFHAAERDEREDHYLVRERDAHAWTEVFTPATDWVIFEPTPAAERTAQSRRRWWTGITDLWQSIEFLWYEKVLGYDSAARRALGGWAARWAVAVWNGVVDSAAAIELGTIKLLAYGYVDVALIRLAATVGSIGLLLAALLIVRTLRRARRAARAPLDLPPVPWKQLSFARKLFALLGRHGVAPRPQQTPRETALEAGVRLQLPVDVLVGLVDLYYRLRWGRAAPGVDEIRAAEQQVAGLARMLANRPVGR